MAGAGTSERARLRLAAHQIVPPAESVEVEIHLEDPLSEAPEDPFACVRTLWRGLRRLCAGRQASLWTPLIGDRPYLSSLGMEWLLLGRSEAPWSPLGSVQVDSAFLRRAQALSPSLHESFLAYFVGDWVALHARRHEERPEADMWLLVEHEWNGGRAIFRSGSVMERCDQVRTALQSRPLPDEPSPSGEG